MLSMCRDSAEVIVKRFSRGGAEQHVLRFSRCAQWYKAGESAEQEVKVKWLCRLCGYAEVVRGAEMEVLRCLLQRRCWCRGAEWVQRRFSRGRGGFAGDWSGAGAAEAL